MTPASLRRKALSEWRGLEESKPRPDRCASVAALLQKILPKLGLADRLCEQQITDAWREVAGDFLAQHSIPAGLAGGILTVQVIQPSVRYELERTWKREILEKLQARFGKRVVREVRFRL
jgi:predicted nucleic acid-binding Zn ribbon protein